mmetsp:Transcript_12878/g.16006  ORF Transcript_12878/g.16006 Transcript_12878/m.16006 type:complete len:82 (-) Transcript_12878:802-1047(-)
MVHQVNACRSQTLGNKFLIRIYIEEKNTILYNKMLGKKLVDNLILGVPPAILFGLWFYNEDKKRLGPIREKQRKRLESETW